MCPLSLAHETYTHTQACSATSTVLQPKYTLEHSVTNTFLMWPYISVLITVFSKRLADKTWESTLLSRSGGVKGLTGSGAVNFGVSLE